MRAFYSIFAFMVVALLVSSCSFSPESILPRKDGKWSFSNVYKTTVGSISNTQNSNGSATFSKDGKGTIQASTASSATEFDWSYNDNTKVITLTTTNQTINSTYKYTVSDAKLSSETWSRKDTISGIIIEDTYTWTKAK
jgi:outer membrane biogenesis lipoprotein LolB